MQSARRPVTATGAPHRRGVRGRSSVQYVYVCTVYGTAAWTRLDVT